MGYWFKETKRHMELQKLTFENEMMTTFTTSGKSNRVVYVREIQIDSWQCRISWDSSSKGNDAHRNNHY